MSTTKDKNVMDLKEEEDIKKRWQHTKKKKIVMTQITMMV